MRSVEKPRNSLEKDSDGKPAAGCRGRLNGVLLVPKRIAGIGRRDACRKKRVEGLIGDRSRDRPVRPDGVREAPVDAEARADARDAGAAGGPEAAGVAADGRRPRVPRGTDDRRRANTNARRSTSGVRPSVHLAPGGKRL